MELMKHQLAAIEKLGNGKVLHGGTGAGKSATVLGYYVKVESPSDIIVITTAKKRDTWEWQREAAHFGIAMQGTPPLGHGTITIDSWNNIDAYLDREDCFFIFDEQRLVGSGAWVKAFQKIAKKNRWVLLTATPGDTWMDYAPIFIANGFYKNITEFKMEHVLYEPWQGYPKIKGYLNERKLEMLRNDVLVEMPFIRHTKRILNYMDVGYDQGLCDRIYKDRWNPFEERPCKDMAEVFRLMRRVVNSDPSRLELVYDLVKMHPRLIVFYNFNYELDILRTINRGANVFEYNGHVKDPTPTNDEWIYLVQYVAGAEAWNCTTTNAMCLYSLTYSYKNFEQVQGRIDRLNTPYIDLFYYILVSNSIPDRAIRRSLNEKHNFNERKVVAEMEYEVAARRALEETYVEGCEI